MFTTLRWVRDGVKPTNKDMNIRDLKVEALMSHSPYVKTLMTYGADHFDIEPVSNTQLSIYNNIYYINIDELQT